MYQCFILSWLSNILLRVYIIFCLSTYQLMDTEYFHFGAFRNDAALNIHVQVLVGTYVFDSTMYIALGVELLGQAVTL